MRRRALSGFVVAVSLLALGALALLPYLGVEAGGLATPEFLLLAGYVVVGELYPLRVPRGGREGLLTVSTTFAFAMLLLLGVVAALVPLLVATVVSDLRRREQPSKTLFNAAQYVLSVVVAGAALQWVLAAAPRGAVVLDSGFGALAVVAAGTAFFVVNFLLSGAAVALASSTPVLPLLRRDLGPQALWTVVLLSLSPIVVAAGERSPWLLPLFIVPMVAVYKSMEIFLQRAHQALHDPLTALPNRALFADRLQQAVLAAQRSGEQAAILIIDLDGFKDVNDTLGHRAGDEVLQVVARRMRSTLRGTDTVARLGGDEFGVVAWPVVPEEVTKAVVSKLRAAIEAPLQFGTLTVRLEASVGVAFSPRHGTDPESLLSYADAAMFRAKRFRTGVEVHDPLQFRETENRMTRLSALRQALQDGRLLLHYQPQFDVHTGRITGAEALVRYHDPADGLVMPGRFIALAEESGLIRDLTRFVLRTVVELIGELQREGIAVRVSVNVSARDLQDPALPEEVAALLSSSEIQPELLELEITERTMMAHPQMALSVVQRLHDLGVTVAIDDFGTGTTSLSLLSELPADCLKIDASLVAAMADAPADAMIVETTINLGHKLGMTVVAEGVESEEIWERLRDLDCDVAQGFLRGRPVPVDELRLLLRSPA